MSKIEIITTEHTLPQEIARKFHVLPELVIETEYYSIFKIELQRSVTEKDIQFLDKFYESADILAFAWSRAIKIEITKEDVKGIRKIFGLE